MTELANLLGFKNKNVVIIIIIIIVIVIILLFVVVETIRMSFAAAAHTEQVSMNVSS